MLAFSFVLKSLSIGLHLLATIVGKYKGLRKCLEPILDILGLNLTEEPEVLCEGVMPIKAASSLAFWNEVISGVSAITAIAVAVPIPGIDSRFCTSCFIRESELINLFIVASAILIFELMSSAMSYQIVITL
jgi:hypothetical protein